MLEVGAQLARGFRALHELHGVHERAHALQLPSRAPVIGMRLRTRPFEAWPYDVRHTADHSPDVVPSPRTAHAAIGTAGRPDTGAA